MRVVQYYILNHKTFSKTSTVVAELWRNGSIIVQDFIKRGCNVAMEVFVCLMEPDVSHADSLNVDVEVFRCFMESIRKLGFESMQKAFIIDDM